MSRSALFDGSPVSIWEEDFSAAKKYVEEKLAASNQSFDQFIKENPEELLAIAEEIRILDANAAALKTFRAESTRHFIDNYSSIFDEETMPAFIDFISKVMAGKVNSDGGIIVAARTLDGEKLTINLSWNVAPECTNDFSKLWFFAIDISEQVKVEESFRKSSHLFRSLYESMNEGVVLHEVIYAANGIPTDYRILDVNPSFVRIVGLARETSQGKLASELYGSGVAPYLDIYSKVADTGEPAYFETYFPPMDQHFSISVFLPQKGMFVTVFTDISERKRTEEKIRQSEQTFRAQFKGFPLPALLWKNDNGNILLLDYNDAASTISINNMADHLGMELEKFFKLFPAIIENTIKCFNEKATIRMEQKYDVSSINRELKIYDIHYVFLTPDMVAIYADDITNRKTSEAELKKHREQLEEIICDRTRDLERATSQLQQAQKMEALGVLAGGIAHDFNNIIATIGVTAEVLLKTIPYNASIHSKLERVLKSSNRAKDLTMKLLTFARKEKLNIKVIHINELVMEVIDILKRTISKTIKIEWALSDNIKRTAVDFNQLVQALLNICLNACDAMPDGGTLKIETREYEINEDNMPNDKIEPGNYCQVTISDTGEGISPAIIDSVFEPFFTTKEIGKGSGLGLAVCHSIVEEHHGFIEVKSLKGEGTSFTVYLPSTELEEQPLDEEPVINALPHKIGTILIIDDDKYFLQTACESLELEGFEVMVANSGRKGVETYSLHKDKIHVVIMDMMMPEMDGAGVFQAIRQINPKTKILISSGYSVQGKASELMKKGAAGFIQKPFKTAEIVEMISSVLNN